MWDSVPKYRLCCVIKGNVLYSNSERELEFNIKARKQTPRHSENPHASADSVQAWMGAGGVREEGDRGAQRQTDSI